MGVASDALAGAFAGAEVGALGEPEGVP